MGEPSIFGTAARAWCSTFSALVRMPLAFLTTLALVVAVNVLTSYLMPVAAAGQSTPSPGTRLPVADIAPVLVSSLLTDILRSLLLAPLAVAVHRFVLLGERSPVLPLTPLSRVLRFACWLIVINIASSIDAFLGPVFRGSGDVATLVRIAAQITAIVVATRLLLFPAIAVDAPGAEPQASWRDSALEHFSP